ncbi:MAG: hypothetical protein RIQ94_1993 [Pseudomonadota bacterium]|jgi:hypothetical protein
MIDSKHFIAIAFEGLGDIYETIKEIEKAKYHYQKSLEIYKSLNYDYQVYSDEINKMQGKLDRIKRRPYLIFKAAVKK